MKRHDRKPDYAARLETVDRSGPKPIDLTNCTVRFIMTAEGEDTPRVSAPAVIDDAVGGIVHYEWAAGDTDVEGRYRAEWEILYPGGLPRTVPSKGHACIEIEADLG